MTTRKKVLPIFIILLLTLSLSACSRGGFRQGWRNSATPTPADEAAHSSDLAEEAEELDDLLNEIDQILKDTDTNVDIP